MTIIALLIAYAIGATAITGLSYILGVVYVLGTNLPEVFRIFAEFLGSLFG